MRIKRLLPHAKQRLYERYGLISLPNGPMHFIKATSNNRKVYSIGEIEFVIRKSDHAVVTILPKKGGI